MKRYLVAFAVRSTLTLCCLSPGLWETGNCFWEKENTHLISKNKRKHTSYKIQKYKHFINVGLFAYPQLQLELAQMSLLVLRWYRKSLKKMYEGYKPKLSCYVIKQFQAPHISYLRSAANIPNYFWSSASLSFAPSSKISVRVMRKKRKK